MNKGMKLAAAEVIFLPFFLRNSISEGKARICLFPGNNEMVYLDWVEEREEVIRAAIGEKAPKARLLYILIRSVGNNEYEYEAGVASADEGMIPHVHVQARVQLAYMKGEVEA
jgi:hypothetical protein